MMSATSFAICSKAQHSAAASTTLIIQLDVISYQSINPQTSGGQSNNNCTVYKINANQRYTVTTSVDSIKYIDKNGSRYYDQDLADKVSFHLQSVKGNIKNTSNSTDYTSLTHEPMKIKAGDKQAIQTPDHTNEDLFVLSWAASPAINHNETQYTTTVVVTTSSE